MEPVEIFVKGNGQMEMISKYLKDMKIKLQSGAVIQIVIPFNQ